MSEFSPISYSELENTKVTKDQTPPNELQRLLEQEESLPLAEIQHAWLYLTEYLRRAIINNDAEIIAAFTQINSQPVSETLASDFILNIDGQNQKLEQYLAHYDDLQQFLSLPALDNKDPRINLKEFYLPRNIRDAISLRYKFSRDLKTLGLMAELTHTSSSEWNVTEDEEFLHQELPSGIQLLVTPHVLHTNPDLLNPHTWQERKQLKDRTYQITANNQNFILKEKKTTRHNDTLATRGTSTLTSTEEFSLAHQLGKNGPVEIPQASFNWEKPLGSVTFPDGFQFVIFEQTEFQVENTKDPKAGSNEAQDQLKSIIENKLHNGDPIFLNDLQEIEARALEIINTRPDLMANIDSSPTASSNQDLKLTTKDYIDLKSEYVLNSIQEALKEELDKRGLIDQDENTDFLYNFSPNNQKLVHATIVDIEHYKKEETPTTDSKKVRIIPQGSYIRNLTSKMRLAAVYAFDEKLGYKLPQPSLRQLTKNHFSP